MTLEELKAAHPDVVAQIRAEGVAHAKADATRAGATAERARILGIMGHPEATDRRALALKLAAMPGMTADSAAELLAGMPRGDLATGQSEFRRSFPELAARALAEAAVPTEDEEVRAYLDRMRALDELDRTSRAENRRHGRDFATEGGAHYLTTPRAARRA